MKRKPKAELHSCGYCEFDEAEGGLIKQCATCADIQKTLDADRRKRNRKG